MAVTPQYNTQLFCDIYPTKEDFLADYNAAWFPKLITNSNAITCYYLLIARFGNNPIANMSVDQWRVKLFSIVWQYGPAWEKRLDIQSKLRGLSDADLLSGSKQISNHALNPNSEPSTSSLEELEFINEQSTSSYKRSKLEAYGQLYALVRTDVTSEFLDKFVNLFKKFVLPENPLLYTTEEE